MIKWSFSGLKDYVNCPKQYHEVKVLKRHTKKVTQQMTYGTEVHKALEDYVRDGTPLPTFYQRYKKMMDSLLEIEGERYLEYKMALTETGEPCAFDSPDYWVRGIVDFMVVVNDQQAFVVDYKTGSNKYPDPKQLQLMALMAFAHFPQLQEVEAGLLFVAHNSFLPQRYKREDQDRLWKDFDKDLTRLKFSYENDKWPENPTPLCGWCPVTDCTFHKVR